ncbi:LuxR family transcriptional regulator [Mycolicibacterium confluentis]|uniref:LuxR family transcriptional regulator n=1 Tax=Mycolicibacterium confluentis TaxID=28047 RepID=A0A7I7XS13_9MYCO|nr:LuxR family transcriptional regulator [Mycolicibacterium confluentis]MCV7318868.1 helix-turn-helix domain-containing protein [Mycolicibacterium confluentis]ORV23028.1 hypothetical protein AWB99_24160 [Mycolicibacterium confluentis]BBZ32020.1 LuxR family transcriptional regulator [Mycolicibacterium confluentis]
MVGTPGDVVRPTVPRWPLTARENELGAITEVLDPLGPPGLLIVGSPGVGRTRLLEEALDSATRAGWVGYGVRAVSAGKCVPLGALAGLDTNAAVAEVLSASERIDGALAKLAAVTAGQPVLLGVDDAHLLDDMSTYLLAQVLHRGLAKVVITTRRGPSPSNALLRLWKDGLLRRVDVDALHRHRCDELVCAVLDGSVAEGCLSALWDLSRGNLVYLRHLLEQETQRGNLVEVDDCWQLRAEPNVSPALRELVLVETGFTAGPVWDVVDVVAAAEWIEHRHLAQLVDRQAIADAERAGLVTTIDDSGEIIVVSHPLYARVSLAQQGPLRTRHLRGRVASVLSVPDGDRRVDPVRLGLLWLDSDLAPNPVVFSEAAEAALARMDLAHAETCARAAMAADGDDRSRVRYAYCLALLGRGGDAADVLSEVSATVLDDDVYRRYVNARELTALSMLAGRTGQESPEPAAPRACRRQEQQADVIRALSSAYANDPAGILESIETVDYSDLDALGRSTFLATRAVACVERGQRDSVLDDVDHDWARLESAGDPLGIVIAVELYVRALVLAGRTAQAAAVTERADAALTGASEPACRLLSAVKGVTALAAGDIGTAVKRLRPAAVDLGESVVAQALSYRYRLLYAIAAARAGHADDAAAALEAVRVSGRVKADGDPVLALARAWVAAARGELDVACEAARTGVEQARHNGQLASEAMCLQTSALLGDTDAAPRLTHLATEVGNRRANDAARFARALSTGNGDGLAEASVHFEKAGELLVAADAAAHAARAYSAQGASGRTLVCTARARKLATRCGVRFLPALVGCAVPELFTPRQLAIAELILAGRTNRDIGAALSLSVRTVEGHIYRASQRTGVQGRRELASLIIEFVDR